MSRRHIIVAILGAVALTVGGSVAWATIPDSNGVIHGCYKKKGGALRVVNGTTCKAKEKPISWNSAGPGGGVAYIARQPANTTVALTNFANTTVTSLSVPAGTYIVNAKVSINNSGASAADANCKLSTGDTVHAAVAASGGGAALPLLDSAAFSSGGTIVLTCNTLKGIAFAGVIAATPVQAVS